MNLSVVICTYNPREEYLARTLAALRGQTVSLAEWELILIDNASREPLSGKWDLSWHPNGRHVREMELGLTCARLRGIREAKGETLVLVDDDNILDKDYLRHVSEIFEKNPFLGVIGGKIIGEYEVPPPAWIKPYLPYLAIVDRGEQELYALTPGLEPFLPYGAGLVLRREVAEQYAQQIQHDPLRQRLDAIGDQLSRAGDSDMALCAFDLKLAKGYYPQLRVTHLIPAERLKRDYMLRLLREGEHSKTSLLLVRGLAHVPQPMAVLQPWLAPVKEWLKRHVFRRDEEELRRAARAGQNRAYADYAEVQMSQPFEIAPTSSGAHAASSIKEP